MPGDVGQRDAGAEVVSKRLFCSANLPGCKAAPACSARRHATVSHGHMGQQRQHEMLPHEPMMHVGMRKQMEDARFQTNQHGIMRRVPCLGGNPVDWRHIVGVFEGHESGARNMNQKEVEAAVDMRPRIDMKIDDSKRRSRLGSHFAVPTVVPDLMARQIAQLVSDSKSVFSIGAQMDLRT